MNITQVKENKKQYLDLLLLADEQESMIDLYLEDGTLYVLEEGEEALGVCVILPIHDGKEMADSYEIKLGEFAAIDTDELLLPLWLKHTSSVAVFRMPTMPLAPSRYWRRCPPAKS